MEDGLREREGGGREEEVNKQRGRSKWRTKMRRGE